MSIHSNSIDCYYEERKSLNDRELKIFNLFVTYRNDKFTDRQVMNHLGFTEPNQVRPRITELIKKRLLMESGGVKCELTGKTVRLVKLKTDDKQMDLF